MSNSKDQNSATSTPPASPAPEQKVGDKKFGQILLDKEFVTPQQLAQAMAVQQKMNLESKRKFKVGEILLFQKVITLAQLHEALREQSSKAEAHRKQALASKEKHQDDLAWMTKIRQKKEDKAKKSEEKPAAGPWTTLISFVKKKKD